MSMKTLHKQLSGQQFKHVLLFSHKTYTFWFHSGRKDAQWRCVLLLIAKHCLPIYRTNNAMSSVNTDDKWALPVFRSFNAWIIFKQMRVQAPPEWRNTAKTTVLLSQWLHYQQNKCTVFVNEQKKKSLLPGLVLASVQEDIKILLFPEMNRSVKPL